MRDTIYRDDAIRVASGYCHPANVAKELAKLPSAQPERKTGRWELAEDGWYCSVCELYPPFDCDPEEKGIPYCPNCGAKMEVEHDTDR